MLKTIWIIVLITLNPNSMKKTKLTLIALSLLITPFIFSQEYRVYVSSGIGASSSIKEFTLQGTYIQDFVSPGSGGLDWPQDIIFLEDQHKLLVSGLNSEAIHQYNSTTGADEGIWADVPGKPTRMKIGPDNLLYVLQWATNAKVLRFQLDGTPLGEFTDTGVTQSIGMEWDASGNLYVSSYGGGIVRKFNSLGEDQGVFISGLSGPTNIWKDPNSSGDFLINHWNGNKVARYDTNGAFVENFIPSIAQPEGYAYLPNGNLLVGSGGAADKIIQYQSNGTLIGDFASGNGLANPNAIYVREDPTGSVHDNSLAPVFVTPTVGTQFNFNESLVTEYQNLQVFAIDGRLMETILLEKTHFLDTSTYSEGLYFLTAEKDGRRFTQKIIVKK